MRMNEASLRKIDEFIERGLSAPHQAASIAVELFKLSVTSRDDGRVSELSARLLDQLPAWGMKGLIDTQARYAKSLASSPGKLLYEEMHKLFSLCDEIRALRYLGLATATAEYEELEAALRERFSTEREKAKLVAQDKAEIWNRDSWWYAENLGYDDSGDVAGRGIDTVNRTP